jgi:hypothetical protein
MTPNFKEMRPEDERKLRAFVQMITNGSVDFEELTATDRERVWKQMVGDFKNWLPPETQY